MDPRIFVFALAATGCAPGSALGLAGVEAGAAEAGAIRQPAEPPQQVEAGEKFPGVVAANMDASAAWIKAHAVAFATSEAGHGFDDLRGLDAIIGDARIVSLGEPTHGTREAFQCKHRLLEYLVERHGFRIFSIEANMPEAYALNEYVLHGRGDPKKLIAGMYFWTWNTEEVLAMVEWMRSWNEKHPDEKSKLQFTGFDMQTPAVAATIVADFAKLHAPELAAEPMTLSEGLTELAMQSGPGGGPSDWTSWTGTFPVEAARGKKLRLSCWIRTEGVTRYCGVWWRNDTPAGVNGFNNMNDQQIKDTRDWARYEFSFDVPADTTNINFGFLIAGEGAAWFDDLEIELDGVRYEDPARFSFDFENDAVRYLMPGSSSYAGQRVETKPHGGQKCLEIRRKPEAEIPKLDAKTILERAEKLLRDLEGRRDALVEKAKATDGNPWGVDWPIQNARVVAQCAKMMAEMTGNAGGFNARDEAMAANVKWILDQNPHEKIVLWAHNGHIGKAEFMGVKWMGGHLATMYGDKMVAVGFATGAGQYTAVAADGGGLKSDHKLAPPPEQSVEAMFMAAGLERAIVDIRRAEADDPANLWAATVRPMRSIGAVAMKEQFFTVEPNAMFDVLVWQGTTTASRPIK